MHASTVEKHPMKQKLSQLLYSLRLRLSRFMYGRYGTDQFNKFLLWAGIGLWAVSLFVGGAAESSGSKAAGIVYLLLYFGALFLLFLTVFRSFSKNRAKRAEWNSRYLSVKNKVTSRFRLLKRRWADRKTYKYFSCPQCGKTVRVPKGKGRLRITCPQCANVFEKKS